MTAELRPAVPALRRAARLAALALPAAFVLPAIADGTLRTVEQTATFSFDQNDQSPVAFASFDDAGGTRTLRRVSLELSGRIALDLVLTNESDQPVETETILAESLVAYIAPMLPAVAVDVSDVVGGGDVLAPGQTFDFGPLAYGGTAERASAEPLALAVFLTDEPVQAYVEGVGDYWHDGEACTLTSEQHRASGKLRLVYEYEVNCPHDVDADGSVGLGDLFGLLDAWGACPGPGASCAADLDRSGHVDTGDLLALLQTGWGPCTE